MTITAAADGSALGNPGPAGWGWYIDDRRWRAGGWPHGTNNQGELQAVLDLLQATADAGEPLTVLCDSQYVINSITRWMPGWKKKGWKKRDGKPVLNVELMKALDAAMQGRDVTFEWVKGHAGHALNEKADELANGAARAFQAGREPEPGPGFTGTSTTTPADTAQAQAASSAVQVVEEDAEDSDPDLLAALGAQQDHLAAGDTPEQEVVRLERSRLLEGLPEASVHPEALLVAADGRPAEPAELTRGRADADVQLLSSLQLSRDAVLVVSHVVASQGAAVHSALWTRQDSRNELGPWQLRHHQETTEA